MTADIHTNSGEAQAQRLERVYEQLSRLLHHPDVVQRLRTAPANTSGRRCKSSGMFRLVQVVRTTKVSSAGRPGLKSRFTSVK